MLRLLLLALILVSAWSVGTAIFARAPRVVLDGLARKLVFRLGLGLGAIAYVVMALGWLGWLRPGVGWGVILVGLAVGLRDVLGELKAARRMRLRTSQTPVSFGRLVAFPHVLPGGAWPRWADLALGVVLLLVVGAGLVIAVAPPVAYDDLTYHLAAPKVYARTGTVCILPYDHHTSFAFTLEMLYTLALLVGDAPLAKLLHTVFWLLTLLAIDVLGREHLGPRTGRLAVLFYALTPLCFSPVGTAYNEFGFALYQLLAWLAFLEYVNHRVTAVSSGGATHSATPSLPRRGQGEVQSASGSTGPHPSPLLGKERGPDSAGGDSGFAPAARQPQWRWVVGLTAGLTTGCKLTGGLLVAFLVAAAVVLGRRDGVVRKAVCSDALVMLLTAALVAAPWLVRTWMVTGNPVFPFGQHVFHSPLWSDDRAEGYTRAQHDFGQRLDERLRPTETDPDAHRRWSRLPGVAWHVTFSPTWFYDRGNNGDGKARLGPVYLAFGLPALLGWLLLLRARPPASYGEERDETTEEVYSPEFRRNVPVPRTQAITERVTLDTARAIGLLLAYTTLEGVFWFASMQYSRYLIPHLALWALLAAWGADGLLRLRFSAAAAALAVAVHVYAGLAFVLVASFFALQVQLGGLAAGDYASLGTPAYGMMQWINANTPADAKVIVYGEPRAYWLDRDYRWGERGHSTLIPDSVRSNPDAYADWLVKELHITHALVNEPIFPTNRTEGGDDVAAVTSAIERGRFRLVCRDERHRVAVYEIR
ncbi:MAG: hypothetical protein HYU66_27300 [Armatimonadetes bacterium]|nr:hypothetical protein [Armatimonadota bacterium]